jgi:methylene-tetrahydromethanopterin dehydrogenase
MAADMLDAARKAMFPPFQVSIFADPSGAFTTAAALVAAVEQKLKKVHNLSLAEREVVVLGGTGPVGAAAAVLASGAGARVRIASHSSAARAQMTSQVVNARYGTSTLAADASSQDHVGQLLQEAEVILACAKAGVQVLSKAQLAGARKLLVAADINAVPPAGIEGIGMNDDGVPLQTASGKAVGIGALAVGNIKYQVMRALFDAMLQSEPHLDFRDAFKARANLPLEMAPLLVVALSGARAACSLTAAATRWSCSICTTISTILAATRCEVNRSPLSTAASTVRAAARMVEALVSNHLRGRRQRAASKPRLTARATGHGSGIVRQQPRYHRWG